MDVRDAAVDVRPEVLSSALMAHLASMILACHKMDDESFEISGTQVTVQVDGMSRQFGIFYALTGYTYVHGVILGDTKYNDEEGVIPNTLEFLLIRIGEDKGVQGVHPLQEVYSISELEAVQNSLRTLTELMDQLYG